MSRKTNILPAFCSILKERKITIALSLLADLKEKYLQIPSGILVLHDYSFLDSISKAFECDSENQEALLRFQFILTHLDGRLNQLLDHPEDRHT